MSFSVSDVTALVALAISVLALFQTMRSRSGDLLITASREKAELHEMLVELGARASIVRKERVALRKIFGPEHVLEHWVDDLKYVEEQVERLLSELRTTGTLNGPFARYKAEGALIRLHIIRAQAQTYVAWIDRDEAHLETLMREIRSSSR